MQKDPVNAKQMCIRDRYIADVCHDGDDGFRWAREQAHDLILLDRMLPSTDGVELLKRLRAQGHTTPVLLVTALGDIGQRVEGLDAGADDYLIKPCLLYTSRCV